MCKAGKGKPCYKLAYFSELRRRLNFVEADLACRRDGGQLLSIESQSEQKVVEQLITELRPADGDFWIGLRRNHGNEDSSSDCSPQYYWADGSKATFRWAEVGGEEGGGGSNAAKRAIAFSNSDIFLSVPRKYILGEAITVFITEAVFLHQAFSSKEFQIFGLLQFLMCDLIDVKLFCFVCVGLCVLGTGIGMSLHAATRCAW